MHLRQAENRLLVQCPVCGDDNVLLLSSVVARLESEGVLHYFECAKGHEFSSRISNEDGRATITTFVEGTVPKPA